MSLKIIKNGLFASVQDGGRYGYGHLGINPGGAMDTFAASLANALLGHEADAPVVEMFFPAPQILFTQNAVICITGAQFAPAINDIAVALNTPIAVQAGTTLTFKKRLLGNCCYLAVANGLQITPWLNSCSTNTRAMAGGWEGRALKKEDTIPFVQELPLNKVLNHQPFAVLPWKANVEQPQVNVIRFIKGPEWHWLTDEAKQLFINHNFKISPQADRMGYRLEGPPLHTNTNEQLVSAGVAFGTLQLLPNAQTILLMADHQTTGGYPKIAQVISAHLPLLAQMVPGSVLTFKETELQAAEKALVEQKKYLQQIRSGSKFNLEKILNAAL